MQEIQIPTVQEQTIEHPKTMVSEQVSDIKSETFTDEVLIQMGEEITPLDIEISTTTSPIATQEDTLIVEQVTELSSMTYLRK